MNKFILGLLFFCYPLISWTQEPTDYFQQELSYDIDVELDDSTHMLSGTVDITYKNQSPDVLSEIYLHLWPNAYKNRTSAFSKQITENGDADFYFAKYYRLGGYKELTIKVNNKVVAWDYWEDNPDIALVELNQALQPGGEMVINTSFKMKIPDSFSRLGHVGQSYQMTQWYPKPAVYDLEGWHPMPYLDQGEFYSEFGNFDVKITLPDNYVVGATGLLQNESEMQFLSQKVAETQAMFKEMDEEKGIEPRLIPSSATMKTIHYTAEDVHDFAWFADKRFFVEQSAVTLASGRKVDTYVMFTEVEATLWAKAINYVNRSVEFYSERVGEYPYPQATAVQSALSAGAGMEYPMITVIGFAGTDRSLDEVITHEVGHNWFYGILASNERDYAWMDEGFNSYYEHEYMEKYYGDTESYLGYEKLAGVPPGESNQIEFYLPMRRRTYQAVNTPSQDLRLLNYWIGAYSMPAYLFEYLEQYLGQEEFDRVMKVYYDTWKFKHPQPRDVKKLLEAETQKDLSWLFEGLIGSTDHLDYKMKKVRKGEGQYILTIENVGEIPAPFPVQIVLDKDTVKTQWIEGFEGEKEIVVPIGEASHFAIDGNQIMPDFNRSNNRISAKGSKIEPFRLKFLGGVENPRRSTIYWTPVIGGNVYDGFMPGVSFYNTSLPSKSLEWSLTPMYGIKSGKLGGLAHVRYHAYPKGLQRISAELAYKSFSYEYDEELYGQYEGVASNLDYNRFKTSLEFEFRNKRARSNRKQILSLELLTIQSAAKGTFSEVVNGVDTTLTYTGHESEWTFIPRLKYHLSNKSTLAPYEINALLEQYTFDRGGGYVKLDLEAKVKILYAKKQGIHLRFFAGTFLYNSKSNIISTIPGTYSLTGLGSVDFWADDFYMGRNEMDGFFVNQIHLNQGGFKAPLNNTFLGKSNIGIITLNAKIDLPINIPNYIPKFRPYVDVGYVQSNGNSSSGDNIYGQLGLAIEAWDDRIGIYVPLFSTKDLKNQLASRNRIARLSFMIDLNRMKPRDILYNFDL